MLHIANKKIVLFLLCIISIQVIAEEVNSDNHLIDYARHGAKVWENNPMAKISGEGQSCVSCHTSLPYGLVEPLFEDESIHYTNLINNINQRITNWDNNTPWYASDKLEGAAELAGIPKDALKSFLNGSDSRGSEAVLNFVVRSMKDAYAGQPASEETIKAFDNLWAEQQTSGEHAGRWNWISANLIPWEAMDSDVWGASLACVAASVYPQLAPKVNRDRLYQSLQRAFQQPEISRHAKSAILLCDAETNGAILDRTERESLVNYLLGTQHALGGWSLRDLGPWTGWEGTDVDCCQQRAKRPDAYATGFVTLALYRTNKNSSIEVEQSLNRANAWIEQQLAIPYPAAPGYNALSSPEALLPEFRNNLYTNGGMMWAYLANWVIENERTPWD